jgi:hypothetical protein
MRTRQFRWLAAASGAAVIAVVAAVAVAQARGGDDDTLAKVRSANAGYHRIEAAQAAGWDLREGLDRCFDNPGTGGMGFHYINLEHLQDLSEDVLHPEALVYAPGPNGQRELAAVEYIVPAAPWDASGKTTPPELLGHHFHLDPVLGVYELHAWIFNENPAGMFADWNPKVACPAS